MMKLFLDTNILIDLLADRKPFSKWSYEIFIDQKKGRWKLFTSSNSIITSYDILSREQGDRKARAAIKEILNRVEVISITKDNLESSLITKFKDYEDAIQYTCAMSIDKIDFIISRNKKDFKHSIIKVLSSEELYLDLNFE